MVKVPLCPICQLQTVEESKGFFICPSCQTVMAPERKTYSYSSDYQVSRGHFDDEIRQHKTQTFTTFLKDGNVHLHRQARIVEVGFGGGAILEFLWQQKHDVYGIEAHDTTLALMRERGFPTQRLSTKISDLDEGAKPVDLLLYLDSFEHLTDPGTHLQDLASVVKKGSRALVVAPRADSFSRKLLGRFWPHNVPDHWIFYSQAGLIQLWERQGWRAVTTWSSRKKISLEMILRHSRLAFLTQITPLWLRQWSFWLRLGEMGVVFEKQ